MSPFVTGIPSPFLGQTLQQELLLLFMKSCPTLCDPVDCSLPGSSVHGISQARIMERVTIFFSKGSSQPRDQT